jgi:hypothetical protein
LLVAAERRGLLQLRVEAGAVEGFETRRPDRGIKTVVASPLFEGLAEVYAAEERRPTPAPMRRWQWQCLERPAAMT